MAIDSRSPASRGAAQVASSAARGCGNDPARSTFEGRVENDDVAGLAYPGYFEFSAEQQVNVAAADAWERNLEALALPVRALRARRAPTLVSVGDRAEDLALARSSER